VENWRNTLLLVGAALAISVVVWILVAQSQRQVDETQAESALSAGIELFQKNRFSEAIELLQAVPAGSAKESLARYYEGSAYMMLGDTDKAIEKLQLAQARTPLDPRVLFALGVASYNFSSVLEINPMDDRERELWEQARGLVDIMASVERRQADGEIIAPPAHDVSGHDPVSSEPDPEPQGA
jgi:tetratricopeptide (TPR) repeat protein